MSLKAVSNNRGAIRLGGREIEAKRVHIPAGADGTLAKTLETKGWQKRVAADGSVVLEKPEPQEKEIPDSFVSPIPGMEKGSQEFYYAEATSMKDRVILLLHGEFSTLRLLIVLLFFAWSLLNFVWPPFQGTVLIPEVRSGYRVSAPARYITVPAGRWFVWNTPDSVVDVSNQKPPIKITGISISAFVVQYAAGLALIGIIYVLLILAKKNTNFTKPQPIRFDPPISHEKHNSEQSGIKENIEMSEPAPTFTDQPPLPIQPAKVEQPEIIIQPEIIAPAGNDEKTSENKKIKGLNKWAFIGLIACDQMARSFINAAYQKADRQAAFMRAIENQEPVMWKSAYYKAVFSAFLWSLLPVYAGIKTHQYLRGACLAVLSFALGTSFPLMGFTPMIVGVISYFYLMARYINLHEKQV